MQHYYFEFKHEGKCPDDAIPHTPVSAIYIGDMPSRLMGSENKFSPQCVSAGEVAEYADKMIKELEAIKQKAEIFYTKFMKD